nr:hypothetical protein [Clostridium paraputrificum]
MKNKGWKRKAKRLIGKCIRNELNDPGYACGICECVDDCVLYCDVRRPRGLGIREVEKRFKEGFNWRETF